MIIVTNLLHQVQRNFIWLSPSIIQTGTETLIGRNILLLIETILHTLDHSCFTVIEAETCMEDHSSPHARVGSLLRWF